MTQRFHLTSFVRFAAIIASASIVFSLIASNVHAQSCSNGSNWNNGGWNKGGCDNRTQPRCCQPKLGFIGEINCHGMEVLQVNRFSPADEIGLRPGDIILKVNGQKVTSHEAFQYLLYEALDRHHGHADLIVKRPHGYPSLVKLCAHLEHTCRQPIGIGH